MTRKGTHDQGTTNGHPLLGRPRDNQRTPRDTPRTDPSETAPFQRSDQGTTNGQPTDSTRRPTKGQISPLYRGRLSPGHEFRNTHNNPKPATQRRIKPKETARDRNRRLSWTNGHPPGGGLGRVVSLACFAEGNMVSNDWLVGYASSCRFWLFVAGCFCGLVSCYVGSFSVCVSFVAVCDVYAYGCGGYPCR